MNDKNIPSYKTAEKNGMTLIKKYEDSNGEIDRVYRITRKEWEESKQ